MSGKKIIQGLNDAIAFARGDKTRARIVAVGVDEAAEALGDAIASLFGNHDNLAKFRRGKNAKSEMAYGGVYAGCMEEAKELRRRLRSRGFVIHRAWNTPKGGVS